MQSGLPIWIANPSERPIRHPPVWPLGCGENALLGIDNLPPGKCKLLIFVDQCWNRRSESLAPRDSV
jgi:hypothetical protein